ncbi:Uncharacterised protein [Vibrio cholerae]|nr:Uncharacterised protein [Vibrio cholerae]CSB82898.1 Uncharacterised protein [Vibrio cholerae]CSC99493.1 Uncharacterised protein [Vibrio cholerae]
MCGCRSQILVFFWQTLSKTFQLFHQRRARFTRFREIARRKEQARCTITQHKIRIRIFTRQFREMHWLFFRWRNFAIFQDLTRIFTSIVGTTHVLTKAAIFQHHV